MPTSDDATADDLWAAVLGRALTLPGYVDPATGHGPATRRKLSGAWRKAHRWAVSTGRTPVTIAPWSTETLGHYAAYLLGLGMSTGAVGNSVSAVRTQHRMLGHPVPDSLPSWALRQVEEHRRLESGSPMTLDDLRKVYTLIPPIRWKGLRDRCLITLTWGSGLSVPRILALNIEDVRITRAGAVLTSRGEGYQEKVVTVARDRRSGMICPVRATEEWVEAMASQPEPAAITGALIRPATRAGIDGTGGYRVPGRIVPGHRLNAQSYKTLWGKLVNDARVGRFSLADLRHAGEADRRQRAERANALH